MNLLTLGLALFFLPHMLPMIPAARNAVESAMNAARYKMAFSAASATGLVLIVIGYAQAPHGAQLFGPFIGARHAAPLVMMISFTLFAAANMKGRIRRSLKHPMLLGLGLWSLTHLLANGHEKATLLFGAFLTYAVVDLLSASARGAVKRFDVVPKHDVIAIGGGILLALVVMSIHRWLFGVAVVPWGV